MTDGIFSSFFDRVVVTLHLDGLEEPGELVRVVYNYKLRLTLNDGYVEKLIIGYCNI